MELGQMLFAQNTQSYPIPDYARALILDLLNEIERVYWNINQTKWESYNDPEIKGIIFRRYWWGDEEAPEASLPNLEIPINRIPSPKISWYKHPGRSMTSDISLDAYKWCEWYMHALKVIEKAEVDNSKQ